MKGTSLATISGFCIYDDYGCCPVQKARCLKFQVLAGHQASLPLFQEDSGGRPAMKPHSLELQVLVGHQASLPLVKDALRCAILATNPPKQFTYSWPTPASLPPMQTGKTSDFEYLLSASAWMPGCTTRGSDADALEPGSCMLGLRRLLVDCHPDCAVQRVSLGLGAHTLLCLGLARAGSAPICCCSTRPLPGAGRLRGQCWAGTAHLASRCRLCGPGTASSARQGCTSGGSLCRCRLGASIQALQ